MCIRDRYNGNAANPPIPPKTGQQIPNHQSPKGGNFIPGTYINLSKPGESVSQSGSKIIGGKSNAPVPGESAINFQVGPMAAGGLASERNININNHNVLHINFNIAPANGPSLGAHAGPPSSVIPEEGRAGISFGLQNFYRPTPSE
eukprot:TRINITY_DN10558_c0_g1_i3.p1 TRINITY_DN10558_c0_g1~~TRINITY_DN10558_c0_g1_i3.p1  ORF type:complete len:165 (+),score=30.06 TRINITY_DN10558_c0_g1_i3:60-497(+)